MSYVGGGNHLVVAAIDFGTARTGFGFGFVSNPSEIEAHQDWPGGGGLNLKTLTNVLLDDEGQFQAFGFEARNGFYENGGRFFECFKMALYNATDDTPMATASDGTTAPVVDVIAHALRYVKAMFMEKFSNASSSTVTESDVLWVLTVPAIWDDQAKHLMRKAAIQAGLIREATTHKLVFALEPEAAILTCMYDDMSNTNLKTGSKVMVVDCGGGTVDISCFEKASDESLSELCVPSGGDWGSTYADRNLDTLLAILFGESYGAFQKTEDYVELMDRWESVKLNLSEDTESQQINIGSLLQYCEDRDFDDSAPSPQQMIEAYNADHNSNLQLKRSRLVIPGNILRGLITPLLDSIAEHVDRLLVKPELDGLDYIFVVGGFAEASLLQQRMSETFDGRNGLQVVVPLRPGLAVIRGAITYGLNPQLVSSRASRLTYGYNIACPWTEAKHSGQPKVPRVQDGKVYCKGVFECMATYGEKIECGTTRVKRVVPLSKSQQSLRFDLYGSISKCVKYVHDPGVQKLGSVEIALAGVGKPCSQRLAEISFTFGNTEIIVVAKDMATGACLKTEIEFKCV